MDIVNMTVLSSATSLPTSYVESAAMPVIWPEIVRTGREVRIGAMTLLAACQVVGLQAELLVQVTP